MRAALGDDAAAVHRQDALAEGQLAPAAAASRSCAATARSGRTNPAVASKYARTSESTARCPKRARTSSPESNVCGTSCARAASIVVPRKLSTPCSGPACGEAIISPPHSTRSSSPVSASIARHSSCERLTSGTYRAPSPIASRVIRVSPWVEPNVCGGVHRSMPSTSAPARAN